MQITVACEERDLERLTSRYRVLEYASTAAGPLTERAARNLVERTPEPDRDEIRHRMAGNLCRCGTYPRIEEAIHSVAGSTETPGSGGAGFAGTGSA